MATHGELRAPGRLQMEPLVRRALVEDLGAGDITSESLVPSGAVARAALIARQEGVLAGLEVAALAFSIIDPDLGMDHRARDGQLVPKGSVMLVTEGRAASILAAERVALNFLQRLSGISTFTARFVAAVEGTAARIVDTRKTTPGLRILEKYAVRCGGGGNHRAGLADAVLIKDNHRAVLAAAGVELAEAVRIARANLPHTIRIEVELDTLDELDAVLAAGADAILLDNMTLPQLAEAVHRNRGRAILEASAGVTLDSVRDIAETGVDLISVGALTHSAPAFDAAVDFHP